MTWLVLIEAAYCNTGQPFIFLKTFYFFFETIIKPAYMNIHKVVR